MNNGSLNISNTTHGLSQTNVWSGYLAPLPVSYLVFDRVATGVSLPSHHAPQYTIPVYDILDIARAIPKLSAGNIEQRVTTPTNTPITLEIGEHGLSIILFSNLSLQSPYSVAATSCRLLSNGMSRLRETLGWLNVLSAASTNVYSCAYGTNTLSPTERSIKDLVLAKSQLLTARVEKFNTKLLQATNQISTAGVPHSYALVTSIQSAVDLQLILSQYTTRPYLRPEGHAGIREYSDCFYGAIQEAELVLLMSSELPQLDATGSAFVDIIVGKNAIYTGRGVFNNGISIRNADLFPYKRNCVIDAYTTFSAGAITSRNLLLKSTPSKR
ncbi:MAG: hypothetical protein ACRCX2_22310 [Paraclostridium sp.]